MKKLSFALLGTFALAGAAFAEDSISIEPGEWSFENTMAVKVDMGGGQVFNMPARTFGGTECITPEDATLTPERLIKDMEEDGGGACEYTDISVSGLTMTSTIKCLEDGMEMTGNYSFTVGADRRSGSGTLDMTGNMEGASMMSNGTLSGAYLGACD
ncbi:MAG: DUF3617 family protein [Pseudomonadota bacterium]